ncbi:MAG: hypothetical protein ABT940_07130, partial [Alphaproteobacteria bacterium]
RPRPALRGMNKLGVIGFTRLPCSTVDFASDPADNASLRTLATEAGHGGSKMSLDVYKKRLERFGAFVEGDLGTGSIKRSIKTPVERFGDDIRKQMELYDFIQGGGKPSNPMLRQKWWYQIASDPGRLLLIPKYKGKRLELKDLFGAQFVVEKTKFKPAMEVLLEMNEKLFFEKQLKELERQVEEEKKAGKTKKKA